MNMQIPEDNKIVGYEQQDGTFLTHSSFICNVEKFTAICAYRTSNDRLNILHKIVGAKKNIVQASVNFSHTILAYITKEETSFKLKMTMERSYVKVRYVFYAVGLESAILKHNIDASSETQMMAQFLYRKKPTEIVEDRLLIFTHQQSIKMYKILQETKKIQNSPMYEITLCDTIMKAFSWAQWDAEIQCLFYIHFKQARHKTDEEEELITFQSDSNPSLMLTALQFHDDMPHETVLNVPLSIPWDWQIKKNCVNRCYNDIAVPLRVHDSSMNVQILIRSPGMIYICFHYLQPCDASKKIEHLPVNEKVNFHYRVIALHHGIILNCIIKDIPYKQAQGFRPMFYLIGVKSNYELKLIRDGPFISVLEQHLVVSVQSVFTHYLDVGIEHKPCCHILMKDDRFVETNSELLVPIPGKISTLIHLISLQVYEVQIDKQLLLATFNETDCLATRLSVLHCLLVHLMDLETATKALMWLKENWSDINVTKYLKEFLVASCYASVSRNLSSDANSLLQLLPLSTSESETSYEMKWRGYVITLKQDVLNDPLVMLLTPRQRLIPFRDDFWTRMWGLLQDSVLRSANSLRFKHSVVSEKLAVSLICYQPEALSRCTTPLSPGGPHNFSSGMLADLTNMTKVRKCGLDQLPFIEIEASAASKQEHVIAVNLREMSMHLVKHGNSPIKVHSVAMRYVSSQLETSRILCSIITNAAVVNVEAYQHCGFSLIDELEEGHRRLFFNLLKRYYLAVDSLSFPLLQGFPSFFTYLSYRVLSIPKFIDYVRSNVLQLNIDVMKVIMANLSDGKDDVRMKLNLLLHLPRSRIKRLMNQWSHPVSLMIRAREHSQNILTGTSSMHSRTTMPKPIRHGIKGKVGVVAFPSNERISPLDTFFELLTAKANLAEIDFNLLIEATVTSTQDFYK